MVLGPILGAVAIAVISEEVHVKEMGLRPLGASSRMLGTPEHGLLVHVQAQVGPRLGKIAREHIVMKPTLEAFDRVHRAASVPATWVPRRRASAGLKA